MKEVRRTKVEQIKRVIIALIFFILPAVTRIRNTAPNQRVVLVSTAQCPKRGSGISADLQERCREIPCRDHIQLIAYSVGSNASRGSIRRWRRYSWKVYEHVEEIVMMAVQMRECVQTMGGQTATVVFAKVVVSMIRR